MNKFPFSPWPLYLERKSVLLELIRVPFVVSEYAVNAPPTAYNFPKRNRLLSGVSHGTIVVEAALNSGSLITARFAAEQNRDVLAFPASPGNRQSQGTNQLLKGGA
ncbi:MAG: hypothetical protein EOO04_16755, partial [Chitinophagaceae bacterium]